LGGTPPGSPARIRDTRHSKMVEKELRKAFPTVPKDMISAMLEKHQWHGGDTREELAATFQEVRTPSRRVGVLDSAPKPIDWHQSLMDTTTQWTRVRRSHEGVDFSLANR